MSEFGDLIKEAFRDSEQQLAPRPERRDLEQASQQFHRRMRAVRGLAAFMVLVMSGLAAWCTVRYVQAEDTAPLKELILYATGFVFSMTAIGWGKMWFSSMQNHLVVVKEIKKTQLLLLDR